MQNSVSDDATFQTMCTPLVVALGVSEQIIHLIARRKVNESFTFRIGRCFLVCFVSQKEARAQCFRMRRSAF